jgi:type IX secretion system PorP/SprF family membrane protein
MKKVLKITKHLLAHTIVVGMMMLVAQSAAGQDPVFSQFYSAPLQLNPGLAGLYHAPAFTINYRNQWPGLNNAYQTYAVGYDQFFEEFNSGLGLYLQTDNAGDGILKTHKLSGIYAYRVQIDRNWQLRLGIEASLIQSRLDWGKLVFGDQLDPIEGPVSPGGTPFPSDEAPPDNFNQTYLDLGTGGVVYNERFYFGLSMRHLNSPALSFLEMNQNLHGGLPLRWSAHAGAELPIRIGNNRNWSPFLSPGIMFVSQGASKQINIGTFFGLGEFYGGTWYRYANDNSDAIIAAIGFRSGNARITYSYDITISALAPHSGGSHEVGIAFNFDDGQRESIYNDCFGLFR